MRKTPGKTAGGFSLVLPDGKTSSGDQAVEVVEIPEQGVEIRIRCDSRGHRGRGRGGSRGSRLRRGRRGAGGRGRLALRARSGVVARRAARRALVHFVRLRRSR